MTNFETASFSFIVGELSLLSVPGRVVAVRVLPSNGSNVLVEVTYVKRKERESKQ